MISVALVTQNIENEKMLNPLLFQGFADDITTVAHDERSLDEIISVSEPIMQRANLDVKALQCAVFYGRRSGTIGITAKMIKSQILLSKTKTSRH